MGTSFSDPSRGRNSSAGLCLRNICPFCGLFLPGHRSDCNHVDGSSFMPLSLPPAHFSVGFALDHCQSAEGRGSHYRVRVSLLCSLPEQWVKVQLLVEEAVLHT